MSTFLLWGAFGLALWLIILEYPGSNSGVPQSVKDILNHPAANPHLNKNIPTNLIFQPNIQSVPPDVRSILETQKYVDAYNQLQYTRIVGDIPPDLDPRINKILPRATTVCRMSDSTSQTTLPVMTSTGQVYLDNTTCKDPICHGNITSTFKEE